MESAIVYDSEFEANQHATAIYTLARDLGIPENEVARLYEIELARFKGTARVKHFITVLVIRKVKDLCCSD